MKSQSEFEEVVKMKDGKHPNPNTIHPIAGYDKEIYVKPTITNPNIIVGDFTYIADSDFESHVSYLYEWNDDKLIIGKLCQIAAGVEFVMNGANHQMNAVSTFPLLSAEKISDTKQHIVSTLGVQSFNDQEAIYNEEIKRLNTLFNYLGVLSK